MEETLQQLLRTESQGIAACLPAFAMAVSGISGFIAKNNFYAITPDMFDSTDNPNMTSSGTPEQQAFFARIPAAMGMASGLTGVVSNVVLLLNAMAPAAGIESPLSPDTAFNIASVGGLSTLAAGVLTLITIPAKNKQV